MTARCVTFGVLVVAVAVIAGRKLIARARQHAGDAARVNGYHALLLAIDDTESFVLAGPDTITSLANVLRHIRVAYEVHAHLEIESGCS